MDQTKNQGGQSNPDAQKTGQQDWNQSQNPNRDQSEGTREQPEPQKPQTPPERGRGSRRERNSSSSSSGRSGISSGSSGISNRGMDREEEQENVPDRGSERDFDQFER